MDFPRRMREWLFNVMKDLADRDEISSHYKELEKEAESEQSLRWSNAAVWQWCNLDKHPEDNVVSRHELFPLKAPLHTLEHCLAPFLDTCDKDTDHLITLQVISLVVLCMYYVLCRSGLSAWSWRRGSCWTSARTSRTTDPDIELIYDFISFYISTLLIASPGLGALAYYPQSLRSRGLVTFQLGVPINFVSNLG